ncbi:uncharacterized protein EAF02_007958 [Botrytis sinoallii]|uniref:uncharacterized protein n=1 Tax=Botrytis sinoallii TaxID=1463999 RepID=UPI0019008814|nr:uncharacterized protein EAF02_007958 [Botrytis sinoallii]KAF7879788.1 hypothetical protein EAF02_007958 [Botrytis sinoallii]
MALIQARRNLSKTSSLEAARVVQTLRRDSIVNIYPTLPTIFPATIAFSDLATSSRAKSTAYYAEYANPICDYQQFQDQYLSDGSMAFQWFAPPPPVFACHF